MTNGNGKRTKDHVLIVDDDIYCVTGIDILLKKAGFSVSHAYNGEEALSMIFEDKNQYDLIFVDLELPRMSGRHLVRELRRNYIGIPVFAVSGYQDKIMIMTLPPGKFKEIVDNLGKNHTQEKAHRESVCAKHIKKAGEQ